MLQSWVRNLPVLRTFEALRVAQARLAATKDEVRKTREQRDRARLTSAHVLSHGLLKQLVTAHAESYRSASPFPHVVLDDVFDPSLLETVVEEFDAMDRTVWHHTVRETEKKSSTEDFHHLGPMTRSLILQLNGASFLGFLERLTGITGLIADAHLRGGGLHEIRQGGMLGVHADFNFYPRLGLYRRLNLLLYLNTGWSEAWGGDLELWDRSGTNCVRRIAPIFNRVVIFDTSNFSYHGHPAPLACPADRSRKSIALYYYTVEPAVEEDRTPHTTMFVQAGHAVDPDSASTEEDRTPHTTMSVQAGHAVDPESVSTL
jgi:Rps23 Pro-64 3,4-dihydroxylase Tpa1-like proline 4-hydroxylase